MEKSGHARRTNDGRNNPNEKPFSFLAPRGHIFFILSSARWKIYSLQNYFFPFFFSLRFLIFRSESAKKAFLSFFECISSLHLEAKNRIHVFGSVAEHSADRSTLL